MSVFPLSRNDALTAADQVWPGVLVALVIAAASQFVANSYGGPTLLYALLLGMAAHFLAEEARTKPGIGFASKTILRLGVALLGARIGVEQIAALGWAPLALVVGGVAVTIGASMLAARALGLDRAQGALTGGATAICGASAALAISAVLPNRPDHQRDTLFTVVAVTSLSTLAMILYPIAVSALGLSDVAAGVFIGGAIHDVAQVVGAGYIISEPAGDKATVTKLFRVALLAPVVLALAIAFRAEAERVARESAVSADAGQPDGVARALSWRAFMPPWFLTTFIILAAVNSLGGIPAPVSEGLSTLSRWCLVIAIAAIGVKTALGDLRAVGWRLIALVIAQTLFLAIWLLTGISTLGIT